VRAQFFENQGLGFLAFRKGRGKDLGDGGVQVDKGKGNGNNVRETPSRFKNGNIKLKEGLKAMWKKKR